MKRFVLLYALYMVIAFFLVDYEPIRQLLHLDEIYTGAVVSLSAWLIGVIGIDVVVNGAFLHLHSAVMEVKFGCNGLEAILLYVAAILAFPAGAKTRIIGILAGSLFLQLLNLMRIAWLAWVLEYHRGMFEVMHEYVTQSIMIALAFFTFIVYLQSLNQDAKPDRNTTVA